MQGTHVKYVGTHGREDGLTGRVSRVLKSGELKVAWSDGSVYVVHPEDVAELT